MHAAELTVLSAVRSRPRDLTGLGALLDGDDPEPRRVVATLERAEFVVRDGDRVVLADAEPARRLASLDERYDLHAVLADEREELLAAMDRHGGQVGPDDLDGAPVADVPVHLDALRGVGAVERADDAYRVADPELAAFVADRPGPRSIWYGPAGERIVTGSDAGEPTAFSAFAARGLDAGFDFGVDYRYRGDRTLRVEEVLVHALAVAATDEQRTLAVAFYRHVRQVVEADELTDVLEAWGCTEHWERVSEFLLREPMDDHPGEFDVDLLMTLRAEHDLAGRATYPRDELAANLRAVGEALPAPVEGYLVGGACLVYHGIRDETKDVDLIVENEAAVSGLATALERLDYRNRDAELPDDDPGAVRLRQGAPMWDVFVGGAPGELRVSERMRDRIAETVTAGKLTVQLVHPDDIFLFKANSNRLVDVEELRVLYEARSGFDWDAILEEALRQAERTDGRNVAFYVLDSLDFLADEYGIEVPIREELLSHCMAVSLERSLEGLAE